MINPPDASSSPWSRPGWTRSGASLPGRDDLCRGRTLTCWNNAPLHGTLGPLHPGRALYPSPGKTGVKPGTLTILFGPSIALQGMVVWAWQGSKRAGGEGRQAERGDGCAAWTAASVVRRTRLQSGSAPLTSATARHSRYPQAAACEGWRTGGTCARSRRRTGDCGAHGPCRRRGGR